MKNIKVKNVIISKQVEKNKNLEDFLKIINKEKINLIIIDKLKKIYIENDVFFEFLWPYDNNFINENKLNNNSIVCKLHYKKFSMLFTGDIEKIAEDKLIEIYKSTDILKSTVLKIAHHGSKTSSTNQFIELINPKIALIGVGENNKFGHPDNQVIKRLKENNVKIYRTDKDGEINIIVDKKGNIIEIKKFVE